LRERLDTAARVMPSRTNTTEDDAFRRRAEALRAKAMSAALTSTESVLQEFEAGVRELQKDFPNRPEVAAMLILLAQLKGGEAAAQLSREVLLHPGATPEMKQRAAAILLELEQQSQATNTPAATAKP
jgi:hypothetical protein